jgi:hypothetical protein
MLYSPTYYCIKTTSLVKNLASHFGEPSQISQLFMKISFVMLTAIMVLCLSFFPHQLFAQNYSGLQQKTLEEEAGLGSYLSKGNDYGISEIVVVLDKEQSLVLRVSHFGIPDDNEIKVKVLDRYDKEMTGFSSGKKLISKGVETTEVTVNFDGSTGSHSKSNIRTLKLKVTIQPKSEEGGLSDLFSGGFGSDELCAKTYLCEKNWRVSSAKTLVKIKLEPLKSASSMKRIQ